MMKEVFTGKFNYVDRKRQNLYKRGYRLVKHTKWPNDVWTFIMVHISEIQG